MTDSCQAPLKIVITLYTTWYLLIYLLSLTFCYTTKPAMNINTQIELSFFKPAEFYFLPLRKNIHVIYIQGSGPIHFTSDSFYFLGKKKTKHFLAQFEWSVIILKLTGDLKKKSSSALKLQSSLIILSFMLPADHLLLFCGKTEDPLPVRSLRHKWYRFIAVKTF